MKIAIVGPGAMGCLFAGFLTKKVCSTDSNVSVSLLGKDKVSVDLINQQGLSIEGVNPVIQVPVKAYFDAEEIGPVDLVILCVKSYDTRQAVLCAKPLIRENTFVLTLQNGIGNVEIASEILSNDNVIAGSTNLGAILLSPGKIKFTGNGETIIGRIDGKIPVEMRYIREIFNKAGFETRISRDIKGLLWSKLIINIGINALSAITGLTNGRLVEFEVTRKILRDAVTEGIRIAKRKRIKLIYDDPLAKVEAVCEATSTNISSMLQDVIRKKRTEIDFINGVIVRQGQELGIPVPVNSVLTGLVRTIESTYEVERVKNK